MPPRLAHRVLVAALVVGAFAALASSQPLAVAAATSAQTQGFVPLWQSVHSQRADIPSLSSHATMSLPEDAAWEGFVTPANRAAGASPLLLEWQGKLVLPCSGIAGSVSASNLVTWDGTRFEALPGLTGFVDALGVWNDHLIVATNAYPPTRFAILQLDGAVWDTLGTANGNVRKFAEYQGELIAGGRFTAVNGVPTSLVAAYDGSSWSAAGTGISGGEVTGLTVHLGKLVAGGASSPAQGVASIDALGSVWQAVGTGFGGGVKDVLSDGVDLFASGRIVNASFTTVLGGLMRWNGTTWSGTGSLTDWDNPNVYMTHWNGKVVINMSASNGPGAVGRLAQWDGVSLTSIPGDSLSLVASGVGTWGTRLVALGNALVANGSVVVPGIVTYDGAQWGTIQEPWSPGMIGPTTNSITAMRAWGGKLIVGGLFWIVADQDHWMSSPRIAAWDGTHWSPLGGGLSGAYIVLGEFQGDLIVAGYNVTVRGTPITRVARWNGSSWSAVGTGAPNDVTSVAEFQSQLYLGSEFGNEGLWHWNGSNWSAVAGLTGQIVYAAGASGARLVVGGSFDGAGAATSPNVAFWDGANWQTAGAGVDGYVDAVADWQGQPVIGGGFTASAGTALPGVAIWDGTQWQPMGTRAVAVYSLRVEGGELYASGEFRLPDDSTAETIAHWTGSDWHVLGSGSNAYPFATYNGYLYQAGYGLVHGHPSHNLSRVPLSAVLDVPRPQPGATGIALSVSPNPARGPAQFAYTLPSPGHARVTVLDLAGRRVATLTDEALDAGPHQARWATPGAPGVYLALLETAAGRVSRWFVVLER